MLIDEPRRGGVGPTLRSAGVTGLLVVGVVTVVSTPLLLGVILAGRLPEIGELRSAGGAWRLLHLLWIFPVFSVVIGLVVEPVLVPLRRTWSGPAVAVLETLLAWGVLTVLMGVFFVDPWGAALAAGVGLVVLAPFTRLLERTADAAERDEQERERRTAGGQP